MKWAAGVSYDEGRLGGIGVYGLRSREEAIEWLNKGFDWKRCFYMLPAWWIKEQR